MVLWLSALWSYLILCFYTIEYGSSLPVQRVDVPDAWNAESTHSAFSNGHQVAPFKGDGNTGKPMYRLSEFFDGQAGGSTSETEARLKSAKQGFVEKDADSIRATTAIIPSAESGHNSNLCRIRQISSNFYCDDAIVKSPKTFPGDAIIDHVHINAVATDPQTGWLLFDVGGRPIMTSGFEHEAWLVQNLCTKRVVKRDAEVSMKVWKSKDQSSWSWFSAETIAAATRVETEAWATTQQFSSETQVVENIATVAYISGESIILSSAATPFSSTGRTDEENMEQVGTSLVPSTYTSSYKPNELLTSPFPKSLFTVATSVAPPLLSSSPSRPSELSILATLTSQVVAATSTTLVSEELDFSVLALAISEPHATTVITSNLKTDFGADRESIAQVASIPALRATSSRGLLTKASEEGFRESFALSTSTASMTSNNRTSAPDVLNTSVAIMSCTTSTSCGTNYVSIQASVSSTKMVISTARKPSAVFSSFTNLTTSTSILPQITAHQPAIFNEPDSESPAPDNVPLSAASAAQGTTAQDTTLTQLTSSARNPVSTALPPGKIPLPESPAPGATDSDEPLDSFNSNALALSPQELPLPKDIPLPESPSLQSLSALDLPVSEDIPLPEDISLPESPSFQSFSASGPPISEGIPLPKSPPEPVPPPESPPPEVDKSEALPNHPPPDLLSLPEAPPPELLSLPESPFGINSVACAPEIDKTNPAGPGYNDSLPQPPTADLPEAAETPPPNPSPPQPLDLPPPSTSTTTSPPSPAPPTLKGSTTYNPLTGDPIRHPNTTSPSPNPCPSPNPRSSLKPALPNAPYHDPNAGKFDVPPLKPVAVPAPKPSAAGAGGTAGGQSWKAVNSSHFDPWTGEHVHSGRDADGSIAAP
ncbi:hypothetical protein MMC27_003415 [Xylographa pallens]|nr:hypothetical protein [Xylographa pallens]